MPIWYFETGNPPFVEQQNPSPGQTGVDPDASIVFYVVDAETYVRDNTIDAYVDGNIAYHNSAFVSPYSGSLTYLSHGSIEGYDAWRLTISHPSPFSGIVSVRAVADDYGYNVLDTTWTFSALSVSPFIERETPYPGSFDSPKDTLVSFDVVDPSGDLNPSLIDAYIDGADAYHGSIGFVSPYDGPLSSIQFIPGGSFWGYDVYRVTIDKTTDYPNIVNVEANYSSVVESSWTFMTKIPVPYISRVNTVYFSDATGIKKIDMVDFVGESQNAAQIILSTETDPPLPDNIVDSLYGETIDGYHYLTFSLKNKVLTSLDWGKYWWGETWDEDYIDRGCFVVKNEVELNQFSDGYKTFAPKINNRGILYLINKDINSIEVYYGAHLYPGEDREPDFVYSTTSTPAIFPGEILCLHISNDYSSELSNGTRLYVGTSLGVTRIDACDVENPDGYCAGLDHLGKSTTYSIAGGGATYEVIGGTSPRVSAISSNEIKMLMFVATDDGYGSAGVSQILMTNNKRTTFMTQESGLIPSNTVRDIYGKTF